MKSRCWVALGILVAAVTGCDEEHSLPNEPEPTEVESASFEQSASSTELTFWQVAGGGYHSCGLTTDNRAYCWGYNEHGQLGTGSDTGPERCGASERFACSSRPLPVAGGHRFRQLSAGHAHTCGVTPDYRTYCWGSNGYGELGDGTKTRRNAPVLVAGGQPFYQVDAGWYHSCGATREGRAYCWGMNEYGELGDGTGTQRSIPVAVAGGLSFRHVSAGGASYFSCGVTKDNRAYCWGRNNYGQLGDSSNASRRNRPSRVAGNRQYRRIDAGHHHACAVTTDNRAFCWGYGRTGELGNGRAYLSFWPRRVSGGHSFDRVTAGFDFTCAERTDDRAYCWGSNRNGQLGDGTTTGSLVPVAVAGGTLFKQLDAGGWHACGKTEAGEGYCWGYGFFGRLGNGSHGSESTPSRVIGPA